MSERGNFIVFEGLDGCGKSTIIKDLEHYYDRMGSHVVSSREPFSDEISGLLRDYISGKYPNPGWRAMSMLFTADRIIHCNHLAKLLEGGISVLSDRYIGSTVAYQTAIAPVLEKKEATKFIEDELSRGMIKPDLTLFLRADVETCAYRMLKSREGQDFYERKGFQKEVSKEYEAWIKRSISHGDKVIVVNAEQGYDSVLRDCRMCLDMYFGGKI